MTSVAHIIRRRRSRRANRREAQSRGRTWTWIAGLVVGLLVIAPLIGVVGVAGLFYVQGAQMVPTPQDSIYLDPIIGATQLFDRDNRVLLYAVEDPLGDDRAWVTLDQLPPHVIEATLLIEDPDFLTVTRFDAWATFQSLWDNFQGDDPLPADQTLTGRLVHNILPSPEFASYESRALEIAQVGEINRRYAPLEVVEWHLNTNYYGNEAYGIEAAALVYFDKGAANLNLAEIALLAAIPPAPQYNPFDDEQAALGRQLDVLRTLLANGAITQNEYDTAINTALIFSSSTAQAPEIAPEFSVYARRQAENILDLQQRDGARLVARGGLRIITTLDLDLYYQAECVLRAHLAQLNSTPTPSTINGMTCEAAALLPAGEGGTLSDPLPDEGVIVMIDATTGELLTLVGNAIRHDYQPGPVLQPFVYFQGFGSGLFNPATMVLDVPRPFPGATNDLIYIPTIRDGQYHGPINLREAMAAGLLPPAAHITNTLQLDTILLSAHTIGLNSLNEGTYDLSLLERGGAVSALDVAYAYSVFAGQGQMHGVQIEPIGSGYRVRDPAAVLRIEDSEGNILWEYDELARIATPIFEPSIGYLVNNVLADREARFGIIPRTNVLDVIDVNGVARPSAVVNGITGNNRDVWTAGYTPQIVAAVRLGRGDNSEISMDTYVTQGSAPVWNAVMTYLYRRDGLAYTDFTRPNDIVTRSVCERSGLLPNGACPEREEIFRYEPTQVDTYWQMIVENSDTGQLATSNTPAALRVERLYFVPPSEAMDWWLANNQALPPTDYDLVSRGDILSSATILQPQALAYVGGVVDVRGSLDAAQMQYYQLSYGVGVNPDQWTAIGDQRSDYAPGTSLGAWDTTNLDGIYTLRLQVVLNDNGRETSTVIVTVDNLPPLITLSAGVDLNGEPRVYRYPGDSVVALEADVQDNLAIDRVEFYLNGEYLGVSAGFPWNFNWTITRTGTMTFDAVAFDRVGNSAASTLTVEIVR